MPPKDTPRVDDTRLGPLTCPVPDKLTTVVPAPLVVMVSEPPDRPAATGVKVTGTVMVPPAPNVAGSVLLGVPSVKWPEADRPVTVADVDAVSVTAWVEDCPTTVAGNVVGGAVTGLDTGAPKPCTVPFRFPTYSRPPATPGGLNFDA